MNQAVDIGLHDHLQHRSGIGAKEGTLVRPGRKPGQLQDIGIFAWVVVKVARLDQAIRFDAPGITPSAALKSCHAHGHHHPLHVATFLCQGVDQVIRYPRARITTAPVVETIPRTASRLHPIRRPAAADV